MYFHRFFNRLGDRMAHNIFNDIFFVPFSALLIDFLFTGCRSDFRRFNDERQAKMD